MTSPRKSILNIEGYDIPLFLDEYKLKLDLNENSMGPSPKVINALQNITAEDIKYYPAYGEVINKLASFNNIDSAMILQANGADEAINYIFDTFVEQDDVILAVTPSFVMPKIYANILGCAYQEINYTEKFVFPIEELLKNIDEKTKLIIITSPNNPTGEAISRENMLKILEAANGKYILIDETYVSYGDESFIDLIKNHSNIFITRSMSKDFGLAGLRFGYIISHKENIGHLKKAIKPYSVNIAAVKAVLAALDDIDYLNYIISQVKESKKLLAEGLKELAVKIYPSNANFLLVDFGEKADFIYKKLLNAGIKVKNCEQTKHLENCLRITLPAVKDAKYILESLKARDLIIFDIDGVLVDIRNSYRMAIKETYRHFSGKEVSPEEIQSHKNYLKRLNGALAEFKKRGLKIYPVGIGTQKGVGWTSLLRDYDAGKYVQGEGSMYYDAGDYSEDLLKEWKDKITRLDKENLMFLSRQSGTEQGNKIWSVENSATTVKDYLQFAIDSNRRTLLEFSQGEGDQDLWQYFLLSAVGILGLGILFYPVSGYFKKNKT